jgi:hypothetical protein
VQKAESVNEFLKRQGDTPQPMGVPGGGAPAPAAPAPNRDAFVQSMMPHALEVSRQTGLDPRLVLAQSALETGYGTAAPGNNYFGIKSHDRPGGQTLATNEAGPGGGMVPTQASFRTYQNPGESAQDYAQFLKTNGRYAPVLGAQGLDAQIDAMAKSGYATDPQYGAKLRAIAQSLPPMGQQPTMGAPPPSMVAQGANAAPMPSVAPQQVGAVPGNPAAMPGGFPMPPGVEQGGGEGQQPVAAPPTIGPLDPVTDNLDALKSGGWLRAGKNNVQLKGPTGGYLYINPQSGQTIEYKPKEDKGGVPGPYVGQSEQGQSLNILVNEGILTVRQAAELGAGKVIQLSDGSTMFFGPQGLVTQPPQGVPNGGGAQPPQPGQPAPASSAPPGAVQLGGPKQTKEMEDYKKARIEFERINAAAQDFLKEWNSTSSNDRLRSLTGANTPLNTSYNILALLSKGEALFNLGVLNGPDLALIRRTLPDPSTLLSGLTKPEDVEKAVGKVVGIMQGSIATREKSLGIAPTAPAADAPKVRKFNPDTGKLE